MSTFEVFLALFVPGVLLFAGGAWLLHEYRHAFLDDPKKIMGMEVFINIVRKGSGPGVVATLAILLGTYLIGVSVSILMTSFR